jgi:hypothetical protein
VERLLHPSFEKAKGCASGLVHGLAYLRFLFRLQHLEHLQQSLLEYLAWPEQRSEAVTHETGLELGVKLKAILESDENLVRSQVLEHIGHQIGRNKPALEAARADAESHY